MTPIAIITALMTSVPSIAKMLGASNNVTKVAEVAADFAKQITGQSDMSKAIESLQADPNLMLQFQIAMQDKEREFEKLYQYDKESARNRDVELAKLGHPNIRANMLIALIAMIMLICLGVVIFVDLNEFARGVVTTMVGVSTTQLANVFSFEFGTTRRKQEDDQKVLKGYIDS